MFPSLSRQGIKNKGLSLRVGVLEDGLIRIECRGSSGNAHEGIDELGHPVTAFRDHAQQFQLRIVQRSDPEALDELDGAIYDGEGLADLLGKFRQDLQHFAAGELARGVLGAEFILELADACPGEAG